MKNLTYILFLSFVLTGCAMQAPTASAQSNDFTLGKVQSQLKEGMSSTEVVSLLGSPNLVTSTKVETFSVFLVVEEQKAKTQARI